MNWKAIWRNYWLVLVLAGAAGTVAAVISLQIYNAAKEVEELAFKNCIGQFYTAECLKDKAERESREFYIDNAEYYRKYKEQH